LNSARPDNPETRLMAEELTAKYNRPVIPLDCINMTVRDINYTMQTILFEFPVRELP
jgi:stage IV sporulation protein A